MNKLLFTIIILIFNFLAIGQEQDIDNRLDECLNKDSNYTTTAMLECLEEAREGWDKELSKYYNFLMGVLEADTKEKLKTSQLKWVEYRDLEYEFSNKMHTDMQGSMWLVVAAERRYETVKTRALELKNYYTTYTEEY